MKRRINISLLGLILFACSVSEPVEQINLSGRYQCDEYGMILMLEHTYKTIQATLQWQGYNVRLNGHYDNTNKQIFITGTDIGYIAFDLIANNGLLAGKVVYNNTQFPIQFRLVNLLKLHDQGYGS